MKFLDANVFIYAYYKAKGDLTKKETQMKTDAQNIIQAIQEGFGEYLTTVVHLSEIANILKHSLSIEKINRLIATLLLQEHVQVMNVTAEDYLEASILGKDLNRDPNDALAVRFMRNRNIHKILSFDTGFDSIPNIERTTEMDVS